MSISTKDELQFLLNRGLEIENKFESLSAWEGFVTVDSDNRKTVLTLARDSHKHRLDLEKLLETLNLEAATNEIPDVTFDFGGMLDAEILQKIIAQDEIAADLYTELAEKTDPKLVAALSGLKNVAFFYQTLNHIVEDEKRHVRIVKALTGTITRIL
jgi:rubrerythrin